MWCRLFNRVSARAEKLRFQFVLVFICLIVSLPTALSLESETAPESSDGNHHSQRLVSSPLYLPVKVEYTTDEVRDEIRLPVYEAARNAWFKGGSLEHDGKPDEAIAKFEEAAKILRRSKHGYSPAFGKLFGERYARCLRKNGQTLRAKGIEAEFCRLTEEDKKFPKSTCRRIPTETREKPIELPRVEPNPRTYFFHDLNVCGVGIDYSAMKVKNVVTIEDLLNKSYLLYSRNELNRESPIGLLEVKNGNGFLDRFDEKISVEEAEKLWGAHEPNVLRGGRTERDCLKFSVIGIENVEPADGIDREEREFSIYLALTNHRQYVVDGPGILFVDPKDAEPEMVLQYVEGGLCRAYVRLEPIVTLEGAPLETIGARLDRQLASGKGVNKITPYVFDQVHYTSGRSERHQKTSPTLPEGAPIPDSR